MRESPSRALVTLDFGDRNSERVVVYFHGFPGSALEAALLDDSASKRGVRVVAFDRPGFGRSPWRAFRNASFTELGQLYASHIQALGVREYSVVGVSGGCPHALALGCAGGAAVRRIVIISGIGELQHEPLLEGMPHHNRLLLRLARGRVTRFLTLPAVAAIARGWRTRPEALIAYMARLLPGEDRLILRDPAFIAPFAASMQRGLISGWQGAFAELRRITRAWHLPLSSLRAPVIFFHGSEDRYVPPSNSQSLAAAIPGSTLQMIPGRGHFMAARFADELWEALGLE